LPVHTLNIGGISCRNNLLLAPMAGISDAPLRLLCLRGGAGLVFAEMVSAMAVKYENARSVRMLGLEPGEHPCAMQIFGGDGEAVALAARAAIAGGADIVDLNCGCPVPKIVRSGAGVALMRDEKKFALVIRAAVAAAGKTPVTVKTRVGLKKGTVLAPRLAFIAQEEGACAVTVHGRYAEAVHSGPVDMDAVAATCASVKIPVMGNGGICDAKTGRAFLDAGCAGLMIGRAAAGDPLIFSRIAAELDGEKYAGPDQRAKAALFLELLDMCAARYGEEPGLMRSRKVLGYWINGFPNCAHIRARFMATNDFHKARNLLKSELCS